MAPIVGEVEPPAWASVLIRQVASVHSNMVTKVQLEEFASAQTKKFKDLVEAKVQPIQIAVHDLGARIAKLESSSRQLAPDESSKRVVFFGFPAQVLLEERVSS